MAGDAAAEAGDGVGGDGGGPGPAERAGNGVFAEIVAGDEGGSEASARVVAKKKGGLAGDGDIEVVSVIEDGCRGGGEVVGGVGGTGFVGNCV